MTSAEFRARQGLPPPGMTAAQVSERSKRFSPAKPQIRIPAKREPNKTESSYQRILESEFPAGEGFKIKYEPITFHLPSGCRYRPDFIVFMANRIILVVETKGGHIHSPASLLRFKEAVSAFPNIKFRFAQRRKTEWTIAE